jgi:molybdate transport system substrate-binding protein
MLAVMTSLFLAASICAPASAESSTVAALLASAVADAMAEIVPLYERSHPGVKIQVTYAGANALEALVESGSGDMLLIGSSTMDPLHSRGKVGTPVPTGGFHEVVLVLKGSTKVRSLHDLAKPGVRIVMGTNNSPIFKYSQQVLEKAAAKFGPNFERAVMANVVTTKTSEAKIVEALKTGAADAAIGFSSDSSDSIEAIPMPAEDDVFTTNLAAVVTGSQHAAAAQAFVDYLHGAEAQAIFRKHHFDAAK